ncbi:DUF4179 domain-containing protein [Paenibacillus agilis]|uniref:DUF4179 domain-containing protein n=1 Tax=Paenibacillus agilis TaxID=3020863 RepID=A0A559J0W3_9BACL|nr:DUF4179 domain-containing protein [Paenibacillus agilis]TVX93528.1 DUF4179 domain-containing protein [Paenibacillus agilis]
MAHLRRQTECTEMEAIENMIGDSKLPNEQLRDRIMSQIEERSIPQRSRRRSKSKPSLLKRTAIALSAASLLGIGIIFSGYVSPVMAATLKNIPVIGVLFKGTSEEAVRTAIDQGIVSQPNLRVTHDGVTLTLTNLLYDGTRLSFLVEREGKDLPFNTTSPYDKEDTKIVYAASKEYEKPNIVPENEKLKGYIEKPILLVNGQELQLSTGSHGDRPLDGGLTAFAVQYTRLEHLPDEFELTVQLKVTRVKEIFEFKIPVKVENKSFVLKPGVTQSNGTFSYTVKELTLSPVSTRLVLDSKGPVPNSSEQTGKYHASKVYYELVDDKGKVVEQSMFGYFHRLPESEYKNDDLYSPFEGTPKSITIRPFTLTVKTKDWAVMDLDQDGEHDRTYLTDLELTIPIKKQ